MIDWTLESRLVITCARGVAPVLATELETLGYEAHPLSDVAVESNGSLWDCMVLNLHLRTAHRVLYEYTSFHCGGVDDLYRHVREQPWEDILPVDGYFTVGSTVRHPDVSDPRFANVKVKDAVVDRLRKVVGSRPDSGPGNHGAGVWLHWHEQRARLFLDTSGESLARRGYRRIGLDAPMLETLAAAALLTAGWDDLSPLVNPMCGSGTVAIEAAWIASRCPPGWLRDQFAFMHLLGYEPDQWGRIRREAEGRKRKITIPILANDVQERAISAARKNARTAGVEDHIEWHTGDFGQLPLPDSPGMVFLNPPYGLRLGEGEDLPALYRSIGDYFKQQCAGWVGAVFTGSPRLSRQVGLRPREKHSLYSGDLDCRLLVYDLYE